MCSGTFARPPPGRCPPRGAPTSVPLCTLRLNARPIRLRAKQWPRPRSSSRRIDQTPADANAVEGSVAAFRPLQQSHRLVLKIPVQPELVQEVRIELESRRVELNESALAQGKNVLAEDFGRVEDDDLPVGGPIGGGNGSDAAQNRMVEAGDRPGRPPLRGISPQFLSKLGERLIESGADLDHRIAAVEVVQARRYARTSSQRIVEHVQEHVRGPFAVGQIRPENRVEGAMLHVGEESGEDHLTCLDRGAFDDILDLVSVPVREDLKSLGCEWIRGRNLRNCGEQIGQQVPGFPSNRTDPADVPWNVLHVLEGEDSPAQIVLDIENAVLLSEDLRISVRVAESWLVV